MKQKAPKAKTMTFLDCGDNRLVELIGSKDIPGATMYLIYHVLDEKIEIADSITVNGILYKPPKGDLVRNGTVLLPTYPEGYGTLPELIKNIQDFIYEYLDISPQYLQIASYYVVLTWIYDMFETIPYLRALGDFGTGKSRFLKAIGSLCYRPIFAGGSTTPSPVFRIIDLFHGTLIMDEADFRFSDLQSEIIKILNCGYSKGVPVLRAEGDVQKMPVAYDVFCPKIIATREPFGDRALESRCLTEVMQGNPRSDIKYHLPKEFYTRSELIRNMLLMFRLKHYGQVELKPELAISGLEARANQILLPILSIVEDKETLENLKKFAIEFGNKIKIDRGEEIQSEVLKAMVDMVADGEALFTKRIAEQVNENIGITPGERAVTPRRIGDINKTYFNFGKRKLNGRTEILWDNKKAKILCLKYSVDNDLPVDLVDKVDTQDNGVSKELPNLFEPDNKS
jgi:hypothetical protein